MTSLAAGVLGSKCHGRAVSQFSRGYCLLPPDAGRHFSARGVRVRYTSTLSVGRSRAVCRISAQCRATLWWCPGSSTWDVMGSE